MNKKKDKIQGYFKTFNLFTTPFKSTFTLFSKKELREIELKEREEAEKDECTCDCCEH